MTDMSSQLEDRLQRVALAGQKVFNGIADIAERVLILAADILLIVYAVISISQDWGRECDENLNGYALWCILLSFMDLTWEFVRCSLDSALDRLQQDFKPQGCSNNQNLLSSGSFDEEGVVGSPVIAREREETSPGRPANIGAGILGQGVRKEKNMRRKRTRDLHFWSLVFTASVSIVFSFFSAHDEECAEKVPSLYIYIHTFTYVYIFRLGVVILWGCCRTVKNYEDAAQVAGSLSGLVPVSQQMIVLS